MSVVNKVRQLESIMKAMEDQKELDVKSLADLKIMQQKRMDSVNKLLMYRKSYEDKLNLTVPSLHANMSQFMRKLNQAIASESLLIDELEREKIILINKINQQESKISAIRNKKDSLKVELAQHNDAKESFELNELSSQQKSRKIYE